MAEISDPDLEQLRRELGTIGRQLDDLDHLRLQPSPKVWAAIEAAITPSVAPITRRRTFPRRNLLALAAAAVVMVILGVGIALRNTGPDSTTVAQAALSNENLDARGAATTGRAAVVQRQSRLVLDLRLERPPPTSGTYLEVWMIDRRVEGMVSLGPFSGDGDYPIPDGIDPAQYPIVDVSLEPTDGVPTHSSVSIIRGVLA